MEKEEGFPDINCLPGRPNGDTQLGRNKRQRQKDRVNKETEQLCSALVNRNTSFFRSFNPTAVKDVVDEYRYVVAPSDRATLTIRSDQK